MERAAGEKFLSRNCPEKKIMPARYRRDACGQAQSAMNRPVQGHTGFPNHHNEDFKISKYFFLM
jgi:hypothetical protein